MTQSSAEHAAKKRKKQGKEEEQRKEAEIKNRKMKTQMTVKY